MLQSWHMFDTSNVTVHLVSQQVIQVKYWVGGIYDSVKLTLFVLVYLGRRLFEVSTHVRLNSVGSEVYHTHVTAAEYFCFSCWMTSMSWLRTLADCGFVFKFHLICCSKTDDF